MLIVCRNEQNRAIIYKIRHLSYRVGVLFKCEGLFTITKRMNEDAHSGAGYTRANLKEEQYE